MSAAAVVGYNMCDHFGDPAPRHKKIRDTIDASLKAMLDDTVTDDSITDPGLAWMAGGIRQVIAAQVPKAVDLGHGCG